MCALVNIANGNITAGLQTLSNQREKRMADCEIHCSNFKIRTGRRHERMLLKMSSVTFMGVLSA